MKLSVLLITGKSDRTALETVQNISGQTGEQAKDIFLIIAGDFAEEDRKKLYLERSTAFGMTAFINVGDKSEAELLNTFIKYANADFCTVMRAGGSADPGFFDRLICALEQEKLDIACGVRISDHADIFTPASQPRGVIDLSKTYGCFPRSFEGTVVRTSYAEQFPFDIEAGEFAEEKGILSMLCGSGKIYYDSSLKLRLADRDLPQDPNTAGYHTARSDKCILPLEDSCKGRDGRLPLFLQHFIMAEVLLRIREGSTLDSFPEEDRQIVLETLTKTLKPVEEKVVCGVYGIAPSGYSITEKRIMLGLKHGREDYYTDITYSRDRLYAAQKDIVLFDSSKLFVQIELMNVCKGDLELDGSFESIFSERRAKVVAEYGGKEYRLTYDRKGGAVMLFGKETLPRRSFHLTLPIDRENRAELRFCILFKGCKYRLKCRFDGSLHSRLSDDRFHSVFPLGDGVFALSESGRLVTQPLGKKEQRSRFKAAMRAAKEEGVSFALRTAYRLTRRWSKGKYIWIFADDTEQGGGAAEDMFRYAMTRHDELYCYYLTDKNSPAAERLTADGYKPLYTGTLLHKLLLLHAQIYMTSKPHGLRENFPGNSDSSLVRSAGMNTVMLQSSPEDIPSPADHSRLTDNVRLFFCGTSDYLAELQKPEYGYEHTDVLRLTGLTSYDRIKDRSGEDKLLLILGRYRAEEEAAFEETEFFGRFKALLENKKLTEALEKHGYDLTIAFEGVTNDECSGLPAHDRVTILTDDRDPEELKSRASLIVTDDGGELSAGIMRKPLIYFGGEGGHGFGERAETPEKLAELLCSYLEEGVKIKPEHERQAAGYFGNDSLGCKRQIYNQTLTYLYENGEIDGYEDFEAADNYYEE